MESISESSTQAQEVGVESPWEGLGGPGGGVGSPRGIFSIGNVLKRTEGKEGLCPCQELG